MYCLGSLRERLMSMFFSNCLWPWTYDLWHERVQTRISMMSYEIAARCDSALTWDMLLTFWSMYCNDWAWRRNIETTLYCPVPFQAVPVRVQGPPLIFTVVILAHQKWKFVPGLKIAYHIFVEGVGSRVNVSSSSQLDGCHSADSPPQLLEHGGYQSVKLSIQTLPASAIMQLQHSLQEFQP